MRRRSRTSIRPNGNRPSPPRSTGSRPGCSPARRRGTKRCSSTTRPTTCSTGSSIGPTALPTRPAPRTPTGPPSSSGEEAIRAIGGAHLILRTSWLYGGRGNNFLMTMLDLVDAGRPISVVSDQFGGADVDPLGGLRHRPDPGPWRVWPGPAWMRERFGTYHPLHGGRGGAVGTSSRRAILERYGEGDCELAPPVHVGIPGERGPARERGARLRGDPPEVRHRPRRLAHPPWSGSWRRYGRCGRSAGGLGGGPVCAAEPGEAGIDRPGAVAVAVAAGGEREPP